MFWAADEHSSTNSTRLLSRNSTKAQAGTFKSEYFTMDSILFSDNFRFLLQVAAVSSKMYLMIRPMSSVLKKILLAILFYYESFNMFLPNIC